MAYVAGTGDMLPLEKKRLQALVDKAWDEGRITKPYKVDHLHFKYHWGILRDLFNNHKFREIDEYLADYQDLQDKFNQIVERQRCQI